MGKYVDKGNFRNCVRAAGLRPCHLTAPREFRLILAPGDTVDNGFILDEDTEGCLDLCISDVEVIYYAISRKILIVSW